MGYGLPVGLDARQAGIGSLVTVATLKTSEGSGKTQTQCLFLRTEKGSFLYSTAKPSSAVTPGAASSVVGGWLRAKTGGGRDIPAGKRDGGLTPPAHIGVNRVRVRSGRRWRKSSNPAAREKTDMNRKRQQSGREDPAAEFTLEERQEERDKGGLAGKHSPRGEKEEVCRSPRCCHSAAPKSCIQRAQRKESQDDCDGGESPTRGASNRLNGEVKGMRKQRQKEEEEEKGGICGLKSSSSHLAGPNPDLEAEHFLPESHSSRDVEEIKKAESNEEQRTQNPEGKDNYSENEQDTNSEVQKMLTGNNYLIHGHSGQVTDDFVSFLYNVDADQESVKELKKVDREEEEGSINQTSAEIMAVRYESVSACASSISTTVSLEPSAPVEGNGCFADAVNCGFPTDQENSRKDHLQGYQQGTEEPGIVGTDKLVVSRLELGDENNTKAQSFIQNGLNPSQPEESEASSSPQRRRDPSLFDKKLRSVTGNRCNYCTTGLNRAEPREELAWEANVEENVLERVNPDKGDEAGAIRRKGGIGCELDDGDAKGDDGMERHTADDRNDSHRREAIPNCAGKDKCRSVEFEDDRRGTQKEVRDRCEQTRIPHVEANEEASANVTNVACADPSTSLPPTLANPAPTMPPLGSMATGLPCPEAVEEEKKERFGVPVREQKRGHEGNGRLGRQPEEQGEERGSTVATEEERDKEEKEEDEFGVFMQAEGEPAWSDEHAMSASVPCGSRERVALENHSIAGDSAHWTPGWTDSSFHQSDNTWTAFSQDSSGEGSDGVAQWWPSSALEKSRLSANQNLESVFGEAFPSPPCPSSDDPCDLHTVPTLSHLFRARASHDLGLLDGFHDLNKMICQRYRRANGVSRDLLLRSLHLEPPYPESRTATSAANRHLSPGLPSANRRAQNAAAKRRLSYDHTKNVIE
ncbi:uncharacterized protein si:ch211-14c7.2 [Pungitius pungitius]|uniref:uncharacterized protein si:ch211-14c7.2 n=1 Tax=Pungitius pungitius TaxID=134920 RepID=UPI002E1300D8